MSSTGHRRHTEDTPIVSCLNSIVYTPHKTMNNSANFTGAIGQGSLEVFTKSLYIYGIPVICVFGILTNILSFKVFVFTSFGNYTSSVYIAALSVSDSGFLASLFLSWLSYGRIGVRYGHYPVWCHAMIYVTYVCSFLSVWYVVLVMVERYIVVCHSLHVSEWCTKKRARIATSVVTLFATFLYCHTFFTAEIKGENCTLQYKPFMIRLLSIFAYTDTFISFVIPFAIIFLLNVIVITSIKRLQLRHKRQFDRKGDMIPTTVLSKAQFRITRTFILMSVVMLVTNVPSHGIRFYIIINKLIHEKEDDWLIYAQQVFQILYYFNFAVNFLLYSASSNQFRKYLTCKHLCSCLYRKFEHRGNEHLYR